MKFGIVFDREDGSLHQEHRTILAEGWVDAIKRALEVCREKGWTIYNIQKFK